ncbi:MAG: hypothetical protein JWL96_4326 [Sphingomonas bacterium]|nr:hypothetical protein [Sphingomonas bacterium]
MWRNRATQDVEEATAPDLEAAAIGRLRRVVGRADGRDVPEVGPQAAAPDCFAGSGLTGNAFAVLGVGLDASAQAISDAVDDLSFEPGHDPDALNAARAALMSARDRLGEELGWLPEMSPALLAQVRAGLKAGDVAAVTAARDATIGLARLNLGLALAVAVPREVERAVRVITDGQAWDSNATLGLLGEARARAGFRPIDDDLYDGAVRERAVARALAPLFAATTSARAALTKAMQSAAAGSANAAGGFGAMFLDEVMRCYAAGIDPALEAAAAKIAAAAAALKERPGDQGQAIALTAGLEIWSSLRRPVQVHEAARGLDDPASAAIFESVRSLTVTLSNEHDEYDIALRLARALIASFALVPFHRAALEQQLPTLIGNVLAKRLRHACARALAAHASFAREVVAGGLERTGGMAGAVAVSFAELAEAWTEERAAAFVIVRALAIDLCNDHRERQAALAIMQWLLLLDPPVEVRQKLTADVEQLGGQAPVPAYRRPSPRQPAGDGDASQNDSSATPTGAAGSFGRANRGGGAPAAPQGGGSSSAWVPPPPEMPPPWQPTPARRGPRGRGTISMVLMLCAMVSFCSRGRHSSSVSSLPPSASSPSDASRYGSASSTYPSAREAAIEARIREYNARLEGEGGARPNRIVPGRPMSDARPMDPTPAVDRPGYAGDDQ